ncbi:MAG: transposase [Candidatus Thermoplasmatota archaeon]
MDAWSLLDVFEKRGWSSYDKTLVQSPVLFLQRVKELASTFPTWQRTSWTGRRPTSERDLLIAVIVKQLLRVSFRPLEGWLRVFADFFEMHNVPDANTISRWNRSRRFAQVLRRFHAWILEQLPERNVIVATDATGYGSTKNAWRTTDYGLRATQPWVKSHVAVEVPQLLYLSTIHTSGRVHESQVFEEVWTSLPQNVHPTRSLADAAYTGEACLAAARKQGATPLHGIKKNARNTETPDSNYEKMVNFATHWPNRYAKLVGKRSLVENVFSTTKDRFGDRLRCRTKIARENEVQAKQTAHNIFVIAMRESIVSR